MVLICSFVWLLPFISPLIVLCFILMLAPYLIQFLWLQITTIAKITINQVMVHYQALVPLTQVTGSSRLLMTPLHYKINQ